MFCKKFLLPAILCFATGGLGAMESRSAASTFAAFFGNPNQQFEQQDTQLRGGLSIAFGKFENRYLFGENLTGQMAFLFKNITLIKNNSEIYLELIKFPSQSQPIPDPNTSIFASLIKEQAEISHIIFRDPEVIESIKFALKLYLCQELQNLAPAPYDTYTQFLDIFDGDFCLNTPRNCGVDNILKIKVVDALRIFVLMGKLFEQEPLKSLVLSKIRGELEKQRQRKHDQELSDAASGLGAAASRLGKAASRSAKDQDCSIQ